METYRYVIIGGGLAGGRACQGIRAVDAAGSTILVAGEHHLPYHRPNLSKGYLRGQEELDQVYVKPEATYAENNIQVAKGTRATRVDPAAHRVTLDDGRVLAYDRLLLATGSRAWRLPIPGHNLPGVYTLRTIEDSQAIQQAARSGRRALVLGGSFIGSEVAASLRDPSLRSGQAPSPAQGGIEVTMVFPESRLLERIVPQELSAYLKSKYAANGVHIMAGTRPQRLEGNGQVQRAVLEDGQTLAVDLVVMGVGVQLNSELARDAGLEMGDKGAVLVDETLRTSDPDIYAAGDIAAWPDPTFGKRLRVEHWDVAWRQGLRAGRNMAGEARPYTTLPYFFSDLFDLSFEVWGDLTNWDQTIMRGSLEKGSYAFYYFHQGAMVGVLAVNRPEQERKPMEALVKARPAYDQVATRLGDESMDLGTVTG